MSDQAVEPAAQDAPTMEPAAALKWVDTAVEEFFGSIEECARHMAAGTLEEIVVSAKLNAFMLRLMSIAQHGQEAAAQGHTLAPGDEAVSG